MTDSTREAQKAAAFGYTYGKLGDEARQAFGHNPQSDVLTSRLAQVRSRTRVLDDQVKAKDGQLELLNKQFNEALAAKAKANEDIGEFDKVQLLLQMTSDYARRQYKERLEEVVTHALRVTTQLPYKFEIRLETRANRPEADYWVELNGIYTQLKPPMYDRGGGIIDPVTATLKIGIGELLGEKGPLFLDEVGKHISKEYAPGFAYFVKEYGRQFNRQVIMVTHNSDLAEVADNAIRLKQVNEVTRIAEGAAE